MPFIHPLKKNLKVCTNCNATYVINGDPSEYWCEIDLGYDKYGKCEFCREGSKFYNK
jgi:hypothetical protein